METKSKGTKIETFDEYNEHNYCYTVHTYKNGRKTDQTIHRTVESARKEAKMLQGIWKDIVSEKVNEEYAEEWMRTSKYQDPEDPGNYEEEYFVLDHRVTIQKKPLLGDRK